MFIYYCNNKTKENSRISVKCSLKTITYILNKPLNNKWQHCVRDVEEWGQDFYPQRLHANHSTLLTGLHNLLPPESQFR